jgi:hypothetical protein
MKIPVETKPALWGVVGGAIALAIVGFGWAGWVTAGTADSTTKAQVDTAVVGALAPVCADRFKRAGDAGTNLATLRRLDYSSQGEFIEKGGWAGLPGAKATDRLTEVARACAVLLLTPA